MLLDVVGPGVAAMEFPELPREVLCDAMAYAGRIGEQSREKEQQQAQRTVDKETLCQEALGQEAHSCSP